MLLDDTPIFPQCRGISDKELYEMTAKAIAKKMKSKDWTKFAAAVKEFRVNRGWTQTELAVYFTIARVTVARIEAGQPVSDRVYGRMKKEVFRPQ